ncbi:MAG: hypothetical protein D6805_06965 [Planctomycetota bacterium]|nr:MAG: hypothetical protein D6805_06965 [Planctomycetota bacterium]
MFFSRSRLWKKSKTAAALTGFVLFASILILSLASFLIRPIQQTHAYVRQKSSQMRALALAQAAYEYFQTHHANLLSKRKNNSPFTLKKTLNWPQKPAFRGEFTIQILPLPPSPHFQVPFQGTDSTPPFQSTASITCVFSYQNQQLRLLRLQTNQIVEENHE